MYSISLKRPGRVGEPKTTFDVGVLAPAAGRAVELRVDLNAYPDPLSFYADLERLLQRARERGEPHIYAPSAGPLPGGQSWSDGTFWSDGTGWTEL